MSTKTAPHLVAEIMANVAAYYGNQVDHAAFSLRNRALWDEADALAISEKVRDCLRMNRTTSWEG